MLCAPKSFLAICLIHINNFWRYMYTIFPSIEALMLRGGQQWSYLAYVPECSQLECFFVSCFFFPWQDLFNLVLFLKGANLENEVKTTSILPDNLRIFAETKTNTTKFLLSFSPTKKSHLFVLTQQHHRIPSLKLTAKAPEKLNVIHFLLGQSNGRFFQVLFFAKFSFRDGTPLAPF